MFEKFKTLSCLAAILEYAGLPKGKEQFDLANGILNDAVRHGYNLKSIKNPRQSAIRVGLWHAGNLISEQASGSNDFVNAISHFALMHGEVNYLQNSIHLTGKAFNFDA